MLFSQLLDSLPKPPSDHFPLVLGPKNTARREPATRFCGLPCEDRDPCNQLEAVLPEEQTFAVVVDLVALVNHRNQLPEALDVLSQQAKGLQK